MFQVRILPRNAALVLLVAIVGLALRWPHLNNRLFTSDAADYVRAARTPPAGIYCDSHSVSLPTLIRLLRAPETHGHLWDYLYRRQDNAALRHFHVPVSFYVASAVHARGGEDRAQRVVASLAGALTGAIVTGGLLYLGAPSAACLLAGILTVADTRGIEVTTEVSPHTWYILFALSCLMAAALSLRGDSRFLGRVALVCLALAIATIEFAPLLIVAFVLAAVLGRLLSLPDAGKLLPTPPFPWLGRTLVGLGMFLFVLWPAGFFKGGYVVSYGFLNIALPLLHSTSYYGPAAPVAILRNFLGHHEALLLLCAGAVLGAAAGLLTRKIQVDSLLFGCYTLAAFLFSAGGRFLYPAYAAEVVVFLAVFAALVWRDVASSTKPAARRLVHACALVVFLLASGQAVWSAWRTPPKDDPLAAVVRDFRDQVPSTEPVLVNDINDGSTYYLYLPSYTFELTTDSASLTPRRHEMEPSIRYALLNTGLLTADQRLRLSAEFEILRAYRRSPPGLETILARKRLPSPQ